MSMGTTPKLRNGLSEGHFYGLHYWRKRKFGAEYLDRLVFERFMFDELGHSCAMEELSDSDGKRLIEAMKLLPDAPVEGQGVLF